MPWPSDRFVCRWAVRSGGAARQTAYNFLSVAVTAHAMRGSGAAEYGVLVFERA